MWKTRVELNVDREGSDVQPDPRSPANTQQAGVRGNQLAPGGQKPANRRIHTRGRGTELPVGLAVRLPAPAVGQARVGDLRATETALLQVAQCFEVHQSQVSRRYKCGGIFYPTGRRCSGAARVEMTG